MSNYDYGKPLSNMFKYLVMGIIALGVVAIILIVVLVTN